MGASTEFNGDQCMVLPTDYLSSPDAAAELHEDELARAVRDLEIVGLSPVRHFFQGTTVATLLWLAPTLWMVCL